MRKEGREGGREGGRDRGRKRTKQGILKDITGEIMSYRDICMFYDIFMCENIIEQQPAQVFIHSYHRTTTPHVYSFIS